MRAANLSERFDKTGGVATIVDPRYPGDGTDQRDHLLGRQSRREAGKGRYHHGGLRVAARISSTGFSLSVDYYKIKIKDAIGQLGAQAVVNQCEAGATSVCSLITRDPTTDRLVLVGNLYININELLVRGVDLEAGYHHDVDLFGGGDEPINARFFASWLLENTNALGGAAPLDRAGQTGIEQSDGNRLRAAEVQGDRQRDLQLWRRSRCSCRAAISAAARPRTR